MIPSLIITFRETLEAALVVGIVLSYLSRTRQMKYKGVLYAGILAGILASIVGAVLFTQVTGGFTGRAEEVFEGVTMLAGALLLTTMILWMLKQQNISRELESRVAAEVAEAHRFGLFSLVFIAVLREGIETVIFLSAASVTANENSLLGALIGIAAAVLIGYVMFVSSRKVNIRTFFNVTSVLLILFAAGLVAQGIHELQEARVLPTAIEHIWDINPPVSADGRYALLHEKGYIGSMLKSLFGFDGNPSLLEVLSHAAYLLAVVVVWRSVGGRSQ